LNEKGAIVSANMTTLYAINFPSLADGSDKAIAEETWSPGV
jgi:hypothetical protein